MPFVCKDNGGIQCQDTPTLSLEDARAFLVSLIGAENVIGKGHTHSRIVIQLCGHSTGVYHHFEITPFGEFILQHGFVGPMGFLPCPGDADAGEQAQNFADDDDNSPTLGKILAEGQYTSCASIPVLVRDLIGRPVRVYKKGDPITKDFVKDRVNIVLDKSGQIIVDIWYG